MPMTLLTREVMRSTGIMGGKPSGAQGEKKRGFLFAPKVSGENRNHKMTIM